MPLTSPHRKWWENVVFLTLAVAMFAFVVNSYLLEQKVYKQRVLYYQLMLLRNGVNIYKLVNRENPDKLLTLAVESYTLPGDNTGYRYIERFPINAKSQVLDPFGKPYVYDKVHGWVMSTSPGYEMW